MKALSIAVFTTILLSACGNGANENKGTETEPATTSPGATVTDSGKSMGDTMMQPNGVSNGTVVVDSTKD
ncbi:hypothetical protein I5907_09560 [Panacibacter sp. DH6]|uniref:Uncharacterized protein n=1 Tax=Panacibacter microcysteis TaxID=2793269 RepID=A0A931E953_9BACT|nr:hypothetical protein [Panacibacter microcysteis]MBG9376479.1 hypothetical protein [Panacibacter microcysteis]